MTLLSCDACLAMSYCGSLRMESEERSGRSAPAAVPPTSLLSPCLFPSQYPALLTLCDPVVYGLSIFCASVLSVSLFLGSHALLYCALLYLLSVTLLSSSVQVGQALSEVFTAGYAFPSCFT